MDAAEQAVLIEIPEQPTEEAAPAAGALKLRRVERRQTGWRLVDVEGLIGPEHKARAIWELVGQLELARFSTGLKTRVGQAGREAWDPQLLVSLWVYAYSEGIGSARQIERQMEWEPGFQWLAGLETVNHHTLSDFRVDHQAALDGLFAQVLGLLEHAGCLSLEQVMHDGTKIRAQAGADTFRRERTVREHLERARAVVEQLGDPAAEENTGRKQAAQVRAARQRSERVQQAWKQLQALQQEAQSEAERGAVRVSLSEPEARLMKHGDNAIAPSYNAQITTDAVEKIIVGVHLSQSSSDAESLEPSLQVVEDNLGRRPVQVVVDGGFTTRDNIVRCAEQKADLIGSLPDPAERSAAAMKSLGIDPAFSPRQFVWDSAHQQLRCPAGQEMRFVRQSRKRGNLYHQYQGAGRDCLACAFQPRCCPRNAAQGRLISILIQERPEVAAFRDKMEQPEAKAIYRKRGAVAEFPNAWIKDKLGLRKFAVRGFAKAGMELLWAALTYNILQWMRLCLRPAAAASV